MSDDTTGGDAVHQLHQQARLAAEQSATAQHADAIELMEAAFAKRPGAEFMVAHAYKDGGRLATGLTFRETLEPLAMAAMIASLAHALSEAASEPDACRCAFCAAAAQFGGAVLRLFPRPLEAG